MVDPIQLPKTDPAELRRLDDEFVAEFAAGTIQAVEVPPLDPASDPFGRNYSWLSVSGHPYDAAFDEVISKDSDEWYQLGGDELRRVVLAGAIAAGSNEDIYRKWVRESFTAICNAAGEEGTDLLEMLKTEGGGMCKDIVFEVATLLDAQPAFSELTNEQRVIAAMIAIKTLNEPLSK